MAQYTTEAIVVGVKNWGEADRIVTMISPDKGRIRATAFGCRRPKSPLASTLQLFNVVEAQLTEGERLDTIRQCSLKKLHRTLIEDFDAMAYGAFVAELAANLSMENFPQRELYERLLEIFSAFGGRKPRVIALGAAYQLLEFSGMQLSYDRCIHCGHVLEADENGWFSVDSGGAMCKGCRRAQDGQVIDYPAALRKFIIQLLELKWDAKPAFKVGRSALLQAEFLMLTNVQQIVERPLQSLEFIRQLG